MIGNGGHSEDIHQHRADPFHSRLDQSKTIPWIVAVIKDLSAKIKRCSSSDPGRTVNISDGLFRQGNGSRGRIMIGSGGHSDDIHQHRARDRPLVRPEKLRPQLVN